MTPQHSLIIRSQLPASQRRHVDEQVRRGALRTILPGIYTASEADTWLDRVHAAQSARPGATLIGPTAARLLFWPKLVDDGVHLAPSRFRSAPPWLHPTLDSIPSALRVISGGLRVAIPALAALQMVDTHGADPIDQVLRSRKASITQLNEALGLWAHRPGNQVRARLLRESRDGPWSELERRGHSLLRKAGIKGWRANHGVRAAGHNYFIDVAFPGLRIAVEFDSWAYHGSREQMEADAVRHNHLQLAGWVVLRFTWHRLDEMPAVVARMVRLRTAACVDRGQ